ncbi:Splicing factor U2af large subunit B [Platanthera guangdongensis]|uniref:Splicing factor U2af large subunit B n=1 Tax=Platanthera guangdongensis TaxID=2320717 RepID=A0ABR2LW69_9ASPA
MMFKIMEEGLPKAEKRRRRRKESGRGIQIEINIEAEIGIERGNVTTEIEIEVKKGCILVRNLMIEMAIVVGPEIMKGNKGQMEKILVLNENNTYQHKFMAMPWNRQQKPYPTSFPFLPNREMKDQGIGILIEIGTTVGTEKVVEDIDLVQGVDLIIGQSPVLAQHQKGSISLGREGVTCGWEEGIKGENNKRMQVMAGDLCKRVSGFDMTPSGPVMAPAVPVLGQVPGAPTAVPGMFQNIFPLTSGQATRHARRVYVGGLSPAANEQKRVSLSLYTAQCGANGARNRATVSMVVASSNAAHKKTGGERNGFSVVGRAVVSNSDKEVRGTVINCWNGSIGIGKARSCGAGTGATWTNRGGCVVVGEIGKVVASKARSGCCGGEMAGEDATKWGPKSFICLGVLLLRFGQMPPEGGQVMAAIGGNTAGPGDAVVNVYINHEKKFAFVEMRSVEEASNAMALDGIIFEGAPVKVRRPSDYNPSLAAALGPSQPNPNLNLAAVGLSPGSAGGLEGPDRVFVGGLPYYFTEAQVRELLESFGSLRGFDLVKDRETGNSKGYAFCVYQDLAVTDIACAALNGIKMGDKTLTVRRANQGVSQPRPEQESVLLHAQQQVALQKLVFQAASLPTKVICLTHVISEDELKDDEEYEDILEDMRGEGGKYGALVNIVIPRPSPSGELVPGVGKVFLEYADTEGSMKARQGLHGRKFGGNQVVAIFYPEIKFSQGEYDEIV